MNILVTGAGGDIGLGLGRILKEWNIFDMLYGMDSMCDHPASLIFDVVLVAPSAHSPNYIDWLISCIKEKDIDLLIPTSEAEIFVIANQLDSIDNFCKILINETTLVNLALDKHETLEYLGGCGLKVPQHGLIGNGSPPTKYPVIVKPRRGQGSKGVRMVSSYKEFSLIPSGYVWQDYLSPADQEYTCAVYISRSRQIRSLILKRVLVGGTTGKASVEYNEEILRYINDITSAFNCPGLFNIQLRLTCIGPLLFEINPRISSTVVFRDKLGFSDLKWWILETLDLPLPRYIPVKKGTRIYRGYNEYIIRADDFMKGDERDGI